MLGDKCVLLEYYCGKDGTILKKEYSCLVITPYSGTSVYPKMSLNEAKFSFIVISGGIPLIQIDNDHSINVSGSQFMGLHQHRFISGSTVERLPLPNLKNIGKAGSFA